MPKLTAVTVTNARPGQARREIHDTGCPSLYLIVQPSGHKSWALRYRVHGHSHKITLGPAVTSGEFDSADGPTLGSPLTLSAARELATKTLRQIRSGNDPAAAKQQKREVERTVEVDTLAAVADKYLRLEGGKLRTEDQRSSDLDLLCKSPLGKLPIEQIKRSEYVRVLDAIALERGPIRSDRVLNAAKRLLNWHAGRSDYVPVLSRAVKRRVSIAERARDRVLSEVELRAVWTTAESTPAPFGPYVRFVLLTATRRAEAGGLRRSELIDPATWILPRARWKVGAKAKSDLMIPLSGAAQAIIAAQPHDDFVFSANGAHPLTDIANHKTKFDLACGVTGWTIHDLRRTSRTLLSRVATADISERCLGHALGGQRGVYDRHSYEVEMRHAFESLAAEIERIVRPPPGAGVVDLAAERGKRVAKS